MPVIIQQLPDKPIKGKHHYRVLVNKELICTFWHERSYKGLAQCLRDAADAVESQRKEDDLELTLKLIEYPLFSNETAKDKE